MTRHEQNNKNNSGCIKIRKKFTLKQRKLSESKTN